MSSFLLSLQMNYGCKDSTKYQRYELFKKERKDTWFAVKWVDILFLYKHQFAVVMTTMGRFSLWAPGAFMFAVSKVLLICELKHNFRY